MTKIIQLAHALGMEIADSEEMKKLTLAKDAYDKDGALQSMLSEYEADRLLIAGEFSKPQGEADERAIADLRARMEELSAEIVANESYRALSEAESALNAIMAEVNAEIKFCITGERPSKCTHDCSSCSGCH